jgi:hypothetical protein
MLCRERGHGVSALECVITDVQKHARASMTVEHLLSNVSTEIVWTLAAMLKVESRSHRRENTADLGSIFEITPAFRIGLAILKM